MNVHSKPLVLRADKGAGKPIPLALAGLPKEIEGRPVFYRRKELARAGTYTHRGTGQRFTIDRARMDRWVAAFKKRLLKGIKPFVPVRHTLDPRADDNKGFVVGLSRDGDSLYADLQLIGDEALGLAAANDISLCAVTDALDADGERHSEVLHHCALTPNPALTNLGGFVAIAASAAAGLNAAPVTVPVYEFSAGRRPQGAPMPFQFQEELSRKLRDKLNLGADVPDEQVAVVAAEHVVAAIDVQARAQKDAERVTALSAENTRLKRELAEAGEKVLALSADAPKELDPRMRAMMLKTFKAARKDAVESGVISESGMQKIDKLLGVDQPNGLALNLSAGDGESDDDMIYTKLCEIIATHPGIKTNASVQRARPGAMSLSAASETGEVSEERKKELLNLSPLGQAILAGSK